MQPLPTYFLFRKLFYSVSCAAGAVWPCQTFVVDVSVDERRQSRQGVDYEVRDKQTGSLSAAEDKASPYLLCCHIPYTLSIQAFKCAHTWAESQSWPPLGTLGNVQNNIQEYASTETTAIHVPRAMHDGTAFVIGTAWLF